MKTSDLISLLEEEGFVEVEKNQTHVMYALAERRIAITLPYRHLYVPDGYLYSTARQLAAAGLIENIGVLVPNAMEVREMSSMGPPSPQRSRPSPARRR